MVLSTVLVDEEMLFWYTVALKRLAFVREEDNDDKALMSTPVADEIELIRSPLPPTKQTPM